MMGDESEFKDIQIQLTELGAIILNVDGTISKVENWQELTPAEQAKTLRVIAKRNARRKAALEQQQSEDAGGKRAQEQEQGRGEEQGAQEEVLAIENK